MRIRSILVLIAIAIVSAGCTTSAPAPVYPPFAGSWLYDYESSVNEQNTAAEAVPQQWSSDLSRDEDKFRERVEKMMRPPEMIVIEVKKQKMFVTGGAGFSRVYNLDGTPPAVGTTNRLEGASLITTVQGSDFNINETWDLTGNGQRLVLSQRIESPRLTKPLVIRSIYELSTRLPH